MDRRQITFLLAALLFGVLGRVIRLRLQARAMNALLAAGWVAFYLAFRASAPG